MKILVTGGVRSGKSRHGESLLSTSEPAIYVAPGMVPDPGADPDWADRVARHQRSRPEAWSTLETRDVPQALSRPEPVIVDCLGTWLTAVMDDAGLWDSTADDCLAYITGHTDMIVAALQGRDSPTVFVTNEVGLGVVPAHRSGRLFRDLLGFVNQQVAAACDEVHLVIAGRVIVL